MAEETLDDWMARPVVRTRHHRRAAAAPDALWDAARGLRLSETGTLGRLVRWRIPGTAPDQTFRALLAEYPFVLLAEGRALVGVGPLRADLDADQRDYPRLDGPDAFRAWDRPGTVRVLFAHWVEPDGDDGSTIVSEARVAPVDRAAEVRLRSLWSSSGCSSA